MAIEIIGYQEIKVGTYQLVIRIMTPKEVYLTTTVQAISGFTEIVKGFDSTNKIQYVSKIPDGRTAHQVAKAFNEAIKK